MLYEAIETISNAKNLEDRFEYELQRKNEKIEEMSANSAVLQTYVQETTTERDYYKKNTLSLTEKKKQVEKEKFLAQENFKKKVADLDRDLKAKTEEAEAAFEAKI